MFSEKELSPQERREKFNKFLGYGYKNARIVAIGSEEGLPSIKASDIDERIEKHKGKVFWIEEPQPESIPNTKGVEGFISKVLKALKENKVNGFENIDASNYNYNSIVHNMNIVPIGCKSEGTAEKEYEYIFGMPHGKLRNYYKESDARKKTIKEFIDYKLSPKSSLIMVMGDIAGKYFIDNKIISSPYLCQYSEWKERRINKSPLKWSSDKLVWLMGHPSYGWVDEEVIEKMIEVFSEPTTIVL